MKNLSKFFRACTALLLAACLMLGLCGSGLTTGANALVLDQKNVNYVSLSEQAGYPASVKGALEQNGHTVALNQLGLAGMRTEDLAVLLNNDYSGDAYTAELFADVGDLADLRAAYQDAVKNADVITLDIGAAAIDKYLVENLTELAQNNEFKWMPTLDDLLSEEKQSSYANYLPGLLELVMSADEDKQGSNVRVGDTVTYALLGFMIHFDMCLDRIYSLNPDVTVVVVGMQRDTKMPDLSSLGLVAPVEEVYAALLDMANVYMADGSAHAESYLFVPAEGADNVHLAADIVSALETGAENADYATNQTINMGMTAMGWMEYYENRDYAYAPDSQSYYLAFGDASALAASQYTVGGMKFDATTSYVDLVAKELGISYKNYAVSGTTAADGYAAVEGYSADIRKADLITIGYSDVTAFTALINTVLGSYKLDTDWSALVGEAYLPMVEAILAELETVVDEQNFGADMEEKVKTGLNNYLYLNMTNMLYISKMVDAIHAINPDVTVVIVGAYNDGISVRLSAGAEPTDFGAYLGDMINLMNVTSMLYASTTENTAYVDVADVEIRLPKDYIANMFLATSLIKNGVMLPSNNGQAYIAGEIVGHQVESLPEIDPYARVLLGDANLDGKINVGDLNLLYRYSMGAAKLSGEQLAAVDLNRNGKNDVGDLNTLYRYISSDEKLTWKPVWVWAY